MSAGAILAIVVVVGEARSPTSAALREAAVDALGPAALVQLVEVPDPTDAAALRVEHDLGADSVVVLSWAEPAQLHAVLRFHAALSNHWIVRSMSFAATDTLRERGRTLGLAAASMTPERAKRADPRPPPPVATAPTAPKPRPGLARERPSQPVEQSLERRDRGLPAEEPKTRPDATSPADAPPSDTVATPSVTPPAEKPRAPREIAPPWPSRRFGVGLAATGAFGIGGSARGAGAEIDGIWFPSAHFGLRAVAGARTGDVPGLPGTDRVARAGIGLEWWPWFGRSRPSWGVGLQASAVALYHRVTGTDETGETETQRRLLPGGDLSLQAVLGLTPAWELIGGAGIEAAAGGTDLRKGTDLQVVATIPALRVAGHLGLRLRF